MSTPYSLFHRMSSPAGSEGEPCQFQHSGLKPSWMIGLLLAFCIGALGIAPYQPNPSHGMGFGFSSPATAPRLNPVGDKNPGPLQQFAAGKHILGFAPGYVVVASGSHALKVEFVDANPVNPHSDQPGGGGKDHPAPELTEVRYPGLWKGIDLAYRADPNGIAETVWKVEPGADIRQARLRYNRPLALNKDGSLNISYPTGSLTESAPVAWQEKDGQRQPITVAFALNGAQELGFTLGNHDPALPVWIDPTLSWNTFLGGAGGDSGKAIAVDGNGNVYVAGTSNATWGSPLRVFSGGIDPFGYAITDAYVAKLDNTGQLVWNTFLGGDGSDYGNGIAVDGNGNVYVTGLSYATWGNPLRAFSDGADAFVAKLDNTGQLVWNTFLGGADYDGGGGIAVDGRGNVYVAGSSSSTWGNPLRAFSGSGNSGGDAFPWSGGDAFAAKLDNTGQLVWNTFLGGSGGDYGNGIAVDGSGNVYVTGYSTATWGSPQRAFSLSNNHITDSTIDAFAAKLDNTGQLVWNTFLGGAAGYSYRFADDYGNAIAVDRNGNVYVTGDSEATWGSPLRAFGGGYDGFVAQLDNTGQLMWNTFLGGDGSDGGSGIAVDGSGIVYVAGGSDVTWGSPLRAYSGGSDAFVAKLGNGVSTATAVTANANPATYGQTVNFTATVTPTTATGTVTFRADGNAITGCGTNGAVNLSNGSATCAFAALTVAGSPHSITATYSGDATYVTSSASLANGQVVNQATATVTTWPTASAITYGQTLASSTLSGGAATPVGSFAFTSPATKPNAGTAAQAVTYTPTDTGNYNTATNTVSVTVGKADLAIFFAPAPTVVGGGIGTITAFGGLSGNPVLLDTQTTGVCALSNSVFYGTNTMATVTGLAPGTCTLAATQAGNANYNPAPTALLSFPITAGLALTVTNLNPAGGTVTSNPGGIACGATCSLNYIVGTRITLTAIPKSNDYQFSGWGGSCSGYGNAVTVTLDAAKTCTAKFDVFKPKRRPKWQGWLMTR